MKEVCRTCGEFVETAKTKIIFSEAHLLQQIQHITGIWLENKADMPNLICINCQNDLKRAMIFRERCLSTQNYLQKCQLRSEEKEKIIAQDLQNATTEATETSFENFDVIVKEEPECSTQQEILDTETIYVNCDVILTENEENTSRKKRSKGVLKTKNKTDYLCDQCGIHFRTQEDLNVHIERHEIDCDTQYANENVLEKDSTEHTQSEITEVELASADVDVDVDINNVYATNSDKNTKRKNIKWKSMSEEEAKALKEKLKKGRDFYCTQCGKHFKNSGNYRFHLIRHKGVKNHECKTCKMKFYTASLMRRHERIHAAQHKCTFCDQQFKYKSSKVRHEKLHTNDRPFKCNYCDKSFPASSSLKNHELRHIGVRQFYCKLCDKGFIRETFYATHCLSKKHVRNEQNLSANKSTSN